MDEDYSGSRFFGCCWSVNLDCKRKMEEMKFKSIKPTKKELEFIKVREGNYKELGEAFEYFLPPINLGCFSTHDDKNLIRLEKRRELLDRKRKAYKNVMKNHPEGWTKDNIQQLKDEMKKEEEKHGKN